MTLTQFDQKNVNERETFGFLNENDKVSICLLYEHIPLERPFNVLSLNDRMCPLT